MKPVCSNCNAASFRLRRLVITVEDTNDLVKVHFDLPEPDMGISGESLWAAPVGPNLYELRNSRGMFEL